MAKNRQSLKQILQEQQEPQFAAQLARLAPLSRRDGLQTDRGHHRSHNSLGAIFNAKVVLDRVG